MEAKILILRELGHLKVPVEIANKASGSITLYHERPSPSDERTVPVLHILDGSSALPAKGVVAQMPVAAEVGSGDERDELGSG